MHFNTVAAVADVGVSGGVFLAGRYYLFFYYSFDTKKQAASKL